MRATEDIARLGARLVECPLDLLLHHGEALLGLLRHAEPGFDLALALRGRLDDAGIHPSPEDKDHQDERDQLGKERPVGREESSRLRGNHRDHLPYFTPAAMT